MAKQLLQPIDPSDNFIAVVTIKRGIDALAEQLNLCLDHGEDDLDRYRVAQMVTETGCKFLLLKYRGYENAIVDIFIPAKLPNYRECVRQIIAELDLPKDEIVERQVAYEQL